MSTAAHRRRTTYRSTARGRRPARRRLPRLYQATLAAMAFGMAFSLVLVSVGLASLSGESPASDDSRPGAQPNLEIANSNGHDHSDHDHSKAGDAAKGAVADVRVKARHVGNLKVEIAAYVTMNEQERALTQAQVVAYTDMVEMPMSHTQGPLPMLAAAGNPGWYVTQTTVPMLGEYDIRVEVQAPVRGVGHKIIEVGVVSPRR
jgi:hypothetical protein